VGPRWFQRIKDQYLKEDYAEAKNNLHDGLVGRLIVAATGSEAVETRKQYKIVKKPNGFTASGKQKYARSRELVSEHVTTKEIPPSPQLLMYLLANQFADGSEKWLGWKARKEVESTHTQLKLNAEFDADTIRRLAGSLFGPNPADDTRKPVISAEVGTSASGQVLPGCVPGNVPDEAPDILQEPVVDIQSEGEADVQESAVHHPPEAG
jgi:hypothetical protein